MKLSGIVALILGAGCIVIYTFDLLSTARKKFGRVTRHSPLAIHHKVATP
jgi:hypothetical protein